MLQWEAPLRPTSSQSFRSVSTTCKVQLALWVYWDFQKERHYINIIPQCNCIIISKNIIYKFPSNYPTINHLSNLFGSQGQKVQQQTPNFPFPGHFYRFRLGVKIEPSSWPAPRPPPAKRARNPVESNPGAQIASANISMQRSTASCLSPWWLTVLLFLSLRKKPSIFLRKLILATFICDLSLLVMVQRSWSQVRIGMIDR